MSYLHFRYVPFFVSWISKNCWPSLLNNFAGLFGKRSVSQDFVLSSVHPSIYAPQFEGWCMSPNLLAWKDTYENFWTQTALKMMLVVVIHCFWRETMTGKWLVCLDNLAKFLFSPNNQLIRSPLATMMPASQLASHFKLKTSESWHQQQTHNITHISAISPQPIVN